MAKLRILANPRDIVEPLARRMLVRRLIQKYPRCQWTETLDYVRTCQQRYRDHGQPVINFERVTQLLSDDLRSWQKQIQAYYKQNLRDLIHWLADQSDRGIIHRRGLDLQDLLEKSLQDSSIYRVARNINRDVTVIADRDRIPRDGVILIRHVIDNESVLQTRMQHNHRFWFIDSGYTNFLEPGRKHWHRLVLNHIHYLPSRWDFPADRLRLLRELPTPWRAAGSDILLVQSSDQHYQMLGTTCQRWTQSVLDELAQHTNRAVVVRPKDPDRKTRQSVWQMLQQEPNRWYCVISHSSAAAVESVWAGIPVITLGHHITNAVGRSKIEDINDLYRGAIGNWLCALSYSQFTWDELEDGRAQKILRRWHDQ